MTDSYMYAALLLHKAGKNIDEQGLTNVVKAAGVDVVQESFAKALARGSSFQRRGPLSAWVSWLPQRDNLEVEVPWGLFQQLNPGDQITVFTRHGRLGYEWIRDYTLKKAPT